MMGWVAAVVLAFTTVAYYRMWREAERAWRDAARRNVSMGIDLVEQREFTLNAARAVEAAVERGFEAEQAIAAGAPIVPRKAQLWIGDELVASDLAPGDDDDLEAGQQV